MKSIGSHPNVVRMLGCWVHSDPIFLLLEYVSYGDLLQWLRNKRIQVSGFSRETHSQCSKSIFTLTFDIMDGYYFFCSDFVKADIALIVSN